MLPEYQQAILDSMDFEQPIDKIDCPVHEFFLNIMNTTGVGERVLKLMFGNASYKSWYAFILNVDFSHPHVSDYLNELFPKEFQDEISQFLFISKCAIEKDMNLVLPYLRKMNQKFLKDKTELQCMDPRKNGKFRFLIPTTRSKARKQKEFVSVDLTSFYKKGDEIWENQPESLYEFTRGKLAYEGQIALAKEKAAKYKEIGCVSMAKIIMDSVSSFCKQHHEVHYGFNRLTITNASVILAKMLECNFCDKIYWPAYKFETNFGFHNGMEYQPRVYQYEEFSDTISIKMEKVIHFLDNYPEIGGKPIFDNYLVLVPSVRFGCHSDGKYYFNIDEGINFSTDNKKEAMKVLDDALIHSRETLPILLGEKDGKCFFICFWE